MEKNFKHVPGAEFPWQYRYEHMAVTTDCVIFTYEDWRLKVLLVRRGGDPYKGFWAFPGGFLKNSETAEAGALRELREETSLEPSSPIVQLGVFSDPSRDPRERVITIAFYALVKPSEVTGGDDAEDARWFPADELPPLAFDHDAIFREALEKLRQDIHFRPVGFDLLDEEFTIPDLQRLYEAILGVKFDRRNFQRKILASGILDPAEPENQSDKNGRMAMRDFDTLFESPEPYSDSGSVMFSVTGKPRVMREIILPEEPKEPRKGRPGRIGSLFRLNRRKYDDMKEKGGKLEF